MTAPIVLCANDTSWDRDTDSLIVGGQGDRYLSPILPHLPGARIARQPEPGAVNAYMNHRRIYRPERWRGEHASVLLSHGIASKRYRDVSAASQYTHTVVPGPALAAEINRTGVPRHQIRILGYPKLDPIHRGEVASPWPARDGRIRVLWAPTHGGGSERHRDGNRKAPGARATTWWHRDELLALLDPDRFFIMEAPHPRHSEGHQATLSRYVGADVVLADGGSTIYESWCVGLPVVFADWLTRERNLERGNGTTLEARVYRDQIGWHATSPEEFPELVTAAAASGITTTEHEFSLEVLPTEYRGVGGKLHAEFLTELAEGPAHVLHATIPRRPEETTVKFVSMKYPNLAVPTLNVRFHPVELTDGRTVGVAEVTTRGAVAHLQTPWMRRRGVRVADEVDLPLADGAPQEPQTNPTGHSGAPGDTTVEGPAGPAPADLKGEKDDQTPAPPQADRPQPPPTSGPGSGSPAWRAYAAEITGAPESSYAALSRADIIDLLRREGVLPDEG